MELPKHYDLSCRKRLFGYPYRLMAIGWMPHHIYVHHGTVIQGCFICLSSNSESESEILKNGKLLQHLPHWSPRFSLLLPGTTLDSVRATYHDELYFHYPAESVDALLAFFGPEIQKNPHFYFPTLPESTVSEIRRELTDLDSIGACDRLDQLAIRLFTEILLCRQKSETDKNAIPMKLHSMASELLLGKSLPVLLRKYAISERAFYREWKKFFSVSPNGYRLKHQLDQACQMLAETERTPGEIAQQCNFGGISYFYQIFRKKKGMTPREFRQYTREHLLP